MYRIYFLFLSINILLFSFSYYTYIDTELYNLFMEILYEKKYLLTNLMFIVLFSFIYITLLIKIKKRFSPKWRVKKSIEIINKIRSKKLEPQQIISYLRKIDPFVFEELLLSCFKEKGIKIKRNKRYTGDGGIDGIIYLNNKKILIQAKRYKKYIQKKHVENFINVCNKHKTKGIFIHTGKTGSSTKKLFAHENIHLISGNELINLILKRPVKIFDKTI